MAIALLAAALLLVGRTAPLSAQDTTSYVIYRAAAPIQIDGRLDEAAWAAAPSVGPFVFPWWTEGAREQTVARLLWDDHNLYAAFVCQDAHVWAVHTGRDSAVYRDDCVEVFAAPNPEQPDTYFNIEMNALGAFLDGFAPHSASHRPSDPPYPPWDGEGIAVKTSVSGTLNDDSDQDQEWVLEAAIPLADYGVSGARVPPQPGDAWHLDLNRCGGHTNEQFSQWRPSHTPRPNFHRPQDFGRVVFSGDTVMSTSPQTGMGTPGPAGPAVALDSLWNAPLQTLDGQPTTLGAYRGRALLVVNVASKCGLTPQYGGLEALQQTYGPRGLTVVGFPCNQFGGQEPGTPAEIAAFCSATYGVTFPMMGKVEVNGPGRHAVYRVLTPVADGAGHSGDIRWNFEKFVIAADGAHVARFAPQVTPADPQFVAAVERALPR